MSKLYNYIVSTNYNLITLFLQLIMKQFVMKFIVFYYYKQIVAADEKYEIHRVVEEAALVVQSVGEHRIAVYVTLTSPIMREQMLHHEGGNRVKAQIKSHHFSKY